MAESIEILEGGRQGRTVILRVTGQLDAKGALALLRRGSAVRAAGDHLVLNLAGVTFAASSGIGALLALAEEFHQGESRVRFACPSSAVASIINLLNLDDFLTIDGSERDALDALAA